MANKNPARPYDFLGPWRIQLKNGTWLRGTITVAFDDAVIITSPDMGEGMVKRDEIAMMFEGLTAPGEEPIVDQVAQGEGSPT
mgnify:CR=1 FL=1